MKTALVRIDDSARLERPGVAAGWRADAKFVAHLIATAAHVPQTRARCRAEPADARAAYQVLGQWPTLPGRTLSRSL